MLYALLLDKPTLALGYAAKHELLMADAGLSGFCLPCQGLEASQMIERFTELENQSAQLTRIISERNAAKVRLVDRQLAEMAAALLPAPGEAGVAAGRKAAPTGAQ